MQDKDLVAAYLANGGHVTRVRKGASNHFRKYEWDQAIRCESAKLMGRAAERNLNAALVRVQQKTVS